MKKDVGGPSENTEKGLKISFQRASQSLNNRSQKIAESAVEQSKEVREQGTELSTTDVGTCEHKESREGIETTYAASVILAWGSTRVFRVFPVIKVKP